MCFSASVSFGSAAVLVTAGSTALTLVKDPRQRWFAALPVLFGVQQAAEGVVWMTLQKNGFQSLHHSSVMVFIFFAFVAWPLWIPWATYQMELRKQRKLWLKACQGAGIVYAIIALYVIATGQPNSEIVGRCLNYTTKGDPSPFFPPNLYAFFYFSSTILPFFVSSVKWVRTTGILIAVGFGVTMSAWKFAVISVWCFFAAIASLYIYVHLDREKKIGAP